MSNGSQNETEIKLRLTSVAHGRRMLRSRGFRMAKRRVFETNTLYDTADLRLRQAGVLLRVRHVGKNALLTYKGPAQKSRHKSREELEVELPDGAGFERILSRLGFEPVFRYEKYRAEYSRPRQRGVATLDETPMGAFLELEGDPEWIDREASRLGFFEADYITASYVSLYLEYHREHPDSPREMVFS